MRVTLADVNGRFEPLSISWDPETGSLKKIESMEHKVSLKTKPDPLAIVGEVVIRRTKNPEKDAKLVERINQAKSLFGPSHVVNVFNFANPTSRKEANTIMKIMLQKIEVHGLDKKS